MSATTETVQAHEHDSHEPPYAEQVKRNRMGLWLFFFSEIFLFGALLAARFYLWGNTRPDLDQTIGVITTSVLLLSSFTMVQAETAMTYGDRKGFLRYAALTAVLGILFLVGVVGIEWQGHLQPGDGVYGGIFFLMTGMHALHVLSGVILILVNWNLARKGHYSAERHWGVEGMALYWHYVDVVWVFFYPALYLIGTPV
ncbi:MAG TPA: cytochrome c oxidase subunit 3 [Anaerolineae bacterium]|jgi:cytochrome c oxidase subunit 3|nr:cytochrome c oxidase subunit 3 [Anaerolineae bacterium]